MSSATFAQDSSKQKSSKLKPNSATLRVNTPGDAHEQEADRVADRVTRGERVSPWSLSSVSLGQVQRQDTPPDGQPPPKPLTTDDMIKKVGEALLQTKEGKAAVNAIKKDPLVKSTTDFLSTPAGIVISGVAATGVVSGLAAAHKPLPMQIPKLPLDFIHPGLGVQLKYEGPVNHPTAAFITLSFTPSSKKKKDEKPNYAAEIAELRAEQEMFRDKSHDTEGLGPVAPPRQPAAQQASPTAPPAPDVITGADPAASHSDSSPKPEDKKREEGVVQRKAQSAHDTGATHADGVQDALRGYGRPLEPDTRHLMESRMGYDFSKVKVYTDSRSADSARSLNARAYTVGSNIVFDSGYFRPQSNEGKKLLAHELAHVVQQNSNLPTRRATKLHAPVPSEKSAASSSLRVGPPHDRYEQEADRAADRVLSGEPRHAAWSLSHVGFGPVQRECSCGGTCDDCKKKKEDLVQREAASSSATGGYAPASVSSTLGRPGSSLDPGTRSFMESRFGHDFSSVRIHTDDRAAASARDVSANAYTVGSSIVFDLGKYQPHTRSGQRLLAHELAHVVQQSGNPRAGTVQRDSAADAKKEKASEDAEADIDEFFAGTYAVFYTDVESQSPQSLLTMANTLSGHYDDAIARHQPQSQMALADVLSRIYHTLKADEARAERDADGSLLWPEFVDLAPWSKERPHSVEDIKLFTAEHVVAWDAEAGAYRREKQVEKNVEKNQAISKKETHTPPPMFDQLVSDASTAAAPPTNAAPAEKKSDTDPVTVQDQALSLDEKDYANKPGGGPEIQAGLDALKGATLGGLKKDGAGDKEAKPGSDKTLFDASGEIWYLSNRMYRVDRTGHLVPSDEAWFDLTSISGLQPGATYFLQSGSGQKSGHTYNFRYYRVQNGGGEPEFVSINFPRVLTALLPVLDLNTELANRNAGAGLIISHSLTTDDKNPDKKRVHSAEMHLGNLLTAVKRLPRHMRWAINAECNRMKENPAGEVANQALAFGLEWVSKYIPVVGQAAMAYQLLELSEWLGDVGNIAAYAKTEDEIDLASQAIARKVAQFMVFEAIHRSIKGGVKVGVKLGGGGEAPKLPEPKLSGDESTPSSTANKPEVKPDVHETGDGAGTGKDTKPATLAADAGKDVKPAPLSADAGKVSAPKNEPLKAAGEVSKTPPTVEKGATGATGTGEAAKPPAQKTMAPEGPDTPKQFDKSAKLAEKNFESPGSGEKHDVIATKEGFGRCSESPCPAIPIIYADEMRQAPEFKTRYDAIRKMGETDVDGATKLAAELAHDIEAYKSELQNAHAEAPKAQTGTVAKPGEGSTDANAGAKQTQDATQGAKESSKTPAKAPDENLKNAGSAPGNTPPTANHAVDDVLSADRGSIDAQNPAVRSRFTQDKLPALDRLDAAYKAYKKTHGADAQSPEGWLKSLTSGEPRQDAESVFGEAYARGTKTGASQPPIPLKDIPRPANYGDARLKTDLATVQKDASIWDRLTNVRSKGITDGLVPNAILNILKGNIGEIFARPEMEGKLANLRNQPGMAGARPEFKTYVQQKLPGGGYEAPKLFSDGLLVTEKPGVLELQDAFEVKSGSHGGQEATSQFFDWREGRLNDGDLLVLSDGRKFMYAPDQTGAPGKGISGFVRGMMRAKAHIIAAKGAEALGTGSSEQVGAEGSRTGLAQTADEMEYLARLLLESLPQHTSPTPAPASTMVTPDSL